MSQFDRLPDLEALLDGLEHAAKALLQPDMWNDFSDEQIVTGLCQQDGEMSGDFIKTFARRTYLEWFSESDEHDQERAEKLLFLELIVQVSLVNEYIRRLALRETSDGQATRSFAVKQDDESLRLLTRTITRRFTWHPELKGNEAEEEVAAMARVKLSQRLMPLLKFRNEPHLLREWLSAALDGTLNRIPDNVRQSVKGQLETIKRRSEGHTEFVASESLSKGPEQQQSLGSYHDTEQRILVEEVRLHASLTSEERVLIEMLLSDKTQNEIAAALGITQPAVYQRLQKIRQKLSSD